METLTGNSRECTELFETNCCVDEISEYSFANSFFAAEVSIDYTCTVGSAVRVAKLHGSCNFVTETITQTGRAQLASSGMHYELKVDFLPPVNIEAVLREKLAGMIRRTSPL